MTYNINSLLWQASFAIAMFFGTFIFYLLPIYIFTKNNSTNNVNANRQQLQQQQYSNPNEQSYHWINNLTPTPLFSTNSYDNNKKYRWKRWLSYCNCISAGVFLGVCFISLIPCVENEFDNLLKEYKSFKNYIGSFSISQFSIICGLFLVLFLENFLSKRFNHPTQLQSDDPPILYLDDDTTDQRSDNHEEELLLNNDEQQPSNSTSNNHRSSHRNHIKIQSTSHDRHDHHHGHTHLNVDQFHNKNESMFSFFILMFATSVHSLFEGMALGLQTNLHTAIHLFIGIILHECLVALAIGLNAVRLQHDTIQMRTHYKFAFVFSLNIPFGNFLGVLIGYTPGHIGRFISAIFQGFAAGTFIHVTFFELIPEEFVYNSDKHHDDHNYKNHNKSDIQSSLSSQHDEQHLTDIDLNDYQHHHGHPDSLHDTPFSLKLKKISLLFIGFLIMSLIAFCFSESN